jgi:hypothetical protein
MKILNKSNVVSLMVVTGVLTSTSAFAKLPDPSPEAKAASALTAAKTAHGDKVSAYQLCLAQDRVAKKYAAKPKAGEKPVETPACKDPGKFEPPAELAAAPVAPATPSAPVAPVKK